MYNLTKNQFRENNSIIRIDQKMHFHKKERAQFLLIISLLYIITNYFLPLFILVSNNNGYVSNIGRIIASLFFLQVFFNKNLYNYLVCSKRTIMFYFSSIAVILISNFFALIFDNNNLSN